MRRIATITLMMGLVLTGTARSQESSTAADKKKVQDSLKTLEKINRKGDESCKQCREIAEGVCNADPASLPKEQAKVCRKGDCSVAMTPDGDGKNSICYRIAAVSTTCYQALDAEQMSKVNSCWAVGAFLLEQRKKELEQIESESIGQTKIKESKREDLRRAKTKPGRVEPAKNTMEFPVLDLTEPK